jgi:single-strand DNA-binding protein
MAGETRITVVGNLTADPELRHTQGGIAVADFTIASTPRTFNSQSREWEDGETLFIRASVWREYADHVSKTLRKGMRVVAYGVLGSRSYQDREGVNRTSTELQVDEVGPSLKYVTATVVRADGDQRTIQQERPLQQRPESGQAGEEPEGSWGVPTERWDDDTPF